VTSPFSLFACPASEVTLDRVRDLLDQTIPECLRLEYKQQKPRDIAKAVAALANTYGGIVLMSLA
jgi:predicted HTH transcriptional regulator